MKEEKTLYSKTKVISICAPLITLTLYLIYNWRSYFFDDEFYTVAICKTAWHDFLKNLILTDVHPPFSYLLFKLWFYIFGPNVYASQALSLLFMMLGLFIYCHIFLKIFPRINWLFIFVAINPLIILWAGSARYYPLLFLFFNLGTFVFLKIFKEADYRLRTLFLFTLVSITGLYTEFMYFLALIPHCFLILFSISSFSENKRASSLKRFSISLLLIISGYLFWLPKTSLLIFENLERFARPSTLLNLAYVIYGSFIGQSVMPYDFFIVIPAVIVFGFLFIFGVVKMSSREKENFYLWLGLALGALVLAIPIRLSTMRHFLFMPGLLLIPVLYSIATFRKKSARVFFTITVLGIYLYGNLNIALKRDIHKGGLTDPIPQVIRKINELAAKDRDSKIFLLTNAFHYHLMENKEISRQIEYFVASEPQVSIKVLDLFRRRRPRHIIYLWSYYGAQPDYIALDRIVQGMLDKDYIMVSEFKFNKDDRLARISRLIDKSYQNPRGYRIIVQEYLLKK